MSNTGYHANGKPCWWARVGSGAAATFLEIPEVRGDQVLRCEVDLPPGTTVFCGAGKGTHKTVRETVVTLKIDSPEGPAESSVVDAEKDSVMVTPVTPAPVSTEAPKTGTAPAAAKKAAPKPVKKAVAPKPAEKPAPAKKATKKAAPAAEKAPAKKTPAPVKKAASAAAKPEPTKEPGGLGKGQIKILQCLAKHPESTRNEIATHTGINSGFTSLLGHADPTKREAQSLLALGLIKADKQDRDGKDVVAYSLTAEGRKKTEKLSK